MRYNLIPTKVTKAFLKNFKCKTNVTVCCAILSAMSITTSPSYALNTGGFFDRKEEGWFWYIDPVEPEEKIEPEVIPPQIAEITEPEEPIETIPTAPTPFSAAWLRDNLPKYLDIATDEPTIENVRNYMYLQRLAMDKATTFSEVSQMAVLGDPYLDEATNRPFAAFASQDLDRKAGVKTDQIIKTIAERAGLFFFFDDGESSLIQTPLIELLVNQNGFSIVPISVTGNDLFENPFGRFVVNDGQAEELDVKSLPALYLVSPATGTVSPIAQSIISLPELKQRILTIAVRDRIISDDEFRTTKPSFNVNNNLASIFEQANLQQLLEKNAKTDPQSPMDEESDTGFIDPKILSDFISRTTRGY